jgi:hypothetical protein
MKHKQFILKIKDYVQMKLEASERIFIVLGSIFGVGIVTVSLYALYQLPTILSILMS